MELKDLFLNSNGKLAEEELVIVGVNPIVQELTSNPQQIFDMLNTPEADDSHDISDKKLKITIIYESESENFNQSLFYDKKVTKEKLDYDKLQTYRSRLIGGKKGKKNTAGFVEDVLLFCKAERPEILDSIKSRIILRQNNLRQFVNIILADDTIRYCFTTLDLPSFEMYRRITEKDDPSLYMQLKQYIDYLMNKDSGGKYLSKPDDELIELYDLKDMPRGIYPRNAFYSTNYQRYSVWAFIFNRKGELLLQKRSPFTKDNRNLWDKSAGGHVDLTDSSTIITVKRELVEELFLPEAEFSKYMSAELGDIVDFGEWNIDKRPEKNFRQEFDGLAPADWVVFRPADEQGNPMTIQRKSPRLMHVRDLDDMGKPIPVIDEKGNAVIMANDKPQYREHVETWYTRFISDVFLFVAPDSYIETQEDLDKLMGVAEQKGAQSAHRLVSIEELIDDVETHPERYTDDMVYMCSEKKWLLVEFSESIRFMFGK